MYIGTWCALSSCECVVVLGRVYGFKAWWMLCLVPDSRVSSADCSFVVYVVYMCRYLIFTGEENSEKLAYTLGVWCY